MRIVIRVLSVLVLSVTAFLFLRTPAAVADGESSAENSAPSVQVAVAVTPPPTVQRSITAVAIPANDATAAFLVGGRVAELLVDVGDVVEAGDVIAILDDRPFRYARDAADALAEQTDAELEQARADHDRAERLNGLNATTDEEVEQRVLAVDALDAAYDARRAQLRESRRQIDETVLYAPVRGTITDRLVEPGSVVDAGMPIVGIRSVDAVEVPLDVPESLIANIETGQSVDLHAPLADVRATGRIVRVVRAPQRHRALYRAIVVPDTLGVLPGMTVTASFDVPVAIDVVVPATAVISPAGEATWLLAVRDGHVERVPVTDLVLTDGDIGLRGSVRPGDEVIVRGHSGLSDGDAVVAFGLPEAP